MQKKLYKNKHAMARKLISQEITKKPVLNKLWSRENLTQGAGSLGGDGSSGMGWLRQKYQENVLFASRATYPWISAFTCLTTGIPEALCSCRQFV